MKKMIIINLSLISLLALSNINSTYAKLIEVDRRNNLIEPPLIALQEIGVSGYDIENNEANFNEPYEQNPSSFALYFAPNQTKLEPYISNFLHRLALLMKANPSYSYSIKANVNDPNMKGHELAWQRVMTCSNYLIELEGIAKERLVLKMEDFGRKNYVEFDLIQ